MEKPRVLSGDALVAKGITKIDATLPELGLKDVTPNGSWLEQKQIQAALEARKYLVEVERIEKCGTLSHAEWRDDLMLAEVTQKTGGYWQYLGHNVGKTLYLRPEEALFLMEINCLLLKHNEVTVSLQKAYSLLLKSSTTLIQYKVYASLSRLGYRVFRHTGPKPNEERKSDTQTKHNADPVIVSMDVESEYVDSPATDKSKFEDLDSPTVESKQPENNDSSKDNRENEPDTVDSSTVSNEEPGNVDSSIVSNDKVPENVDSSIVSKEEEPENVDSSTVSNQKEPRDGDVDVSNEKESESADVLIVSTVNVSKNVISPIITTPHESKSEEPSVTMTNECEKPQSDIPKENIVSDLKSENVPEADTTIESEMAENPKDIVTVKISENREAPIESETNKLRVNDQDVRNIGEVGEVKDNEEITEQLDADNTVAKENESPNIMEVDESTELKTAENKADIMQEVSSTIAEIKENVENKIDSMEICTENLETDTVIMKESVETSMDVEITSAEEHNVTSNTTIDLVDDADTSEDAVSATNSEVDRKRKHTGTQTKRSSVNKTDPTDNCTSTKSKTQLNSCSKDSDSYNYLTKIEKLTKRQLKPSDSKTIEMYFENIPDLSKGHIVTINVPEQQFLPKNIFVNKSSYMLNLQNIKMRSIRSASSESPAYTSSDEVNGNNIRRIRSSSEVALSTEFSQNPNYFPQARFPRYNNFRPFQTGFWRPQNNLNFYQLMFIQTRMQYHHWRPPCFAVNHSNLHLSNNARKRIMSGRAAHFQGIKNLAVRLKLSLISGNTDMGNLETLHSLLHSYNLRYKTRLRLTEHFDVVNEEKIVETIELDDDEESKSKKPRLEKEDDNKFDENLYRLRQLALRLKDLESKDKATASHRRAFSKAIKTFNKSYNADVYLHEGSYEVIDRRCITLDSSSESDCVVEEQVKVRSKKLRNPFNILKRRKERLMSLNKPSTSKEDNSTNCNITDPATPELDGGNNKYSEFLRKTFNESWLPNEEDFGRAEIVPKTSMASRFEISNKELFLYDYIKEHFQPCQNWLEAKLSFLRYLEETNIAFKSQKAQILADAELCNTGLKPLIDFEDNSDMPSVLEKLRIIENNKEFAPDTSLKIDFDVYNRNVQNFRKRNPPKPHFRIICVDESSGVPSAAHVMALHSKYDENVPIVFAIVSASSISYLQIKPTDLPVYVPNNDTE